MRTLEEFECWKCDFQKFKEEFSGEKQKPSNENKETQVNICKRVNDQSIQNRVVFLNLKKSVPKLTCVGTVTVI